MAEHGAEQRRRGVRTGGGMGVQELVVGYDIRDGARAAVVLFVKLQAALSDWKSDCCSDDGAHSIARGIGECQPDAGEVCQPDAVYQCAA